jgi:hypothetical protein
LYHFLSPREAQRFPPAIHRVINGLVNFENFKWSGIFAGGLTFHREGESCGIPFVHTSFIVKGKMKKEINSLVHF